LIHFYKRLTLKLLKVLFYRIWPCVFLTANPDMNYVDA